MKDNSINLPDPCSSRVITYMKSQGYVHLCVLSFQIELIRYRKIGGDVCSGGVESQYNKVLASCNDASQLNLFL